MAENYFNQLPFRRQLAQLQQCRFMQANEFEAGCQELVGKKVVIVGCGAQGLNQGLNMRDSGLDVSYALRPAAIEEKRPSWQSASREKFSVGSYEELIPSADLVINLTPDKQHSAVVEAVMPLMKKGATLGYSHGFNIVEVGQKIRDDITVIMVAPKCPGTEVREEYLRGFGVPTLIAVHPENDPNGHGLAWAKAWAAATGGHRAGVLESSFVAEVKSDLMGEQTILCGMLQVGSLLCFEHMVNSGIEAAEAAHLVQYGWEEITEALKFGGITLMMSNLDRASRVRAYQLAEQAKEALTPLFNKHQDDILSGAFSKQMMQDWQNNDHDLLSWRENTRQSAFEQAPASDQQRSCNDFFARGVVMVALVKAGVELAFETMVNAGIRSESAYYESLHELPLIANTIARKRLYEMNVVISDTAEYGNYLFANAAYPLLQKELFAHISSSDIGLGLTAESATFDYPVLNTINEAIYQHPIEQIGRKLRRYMKDMQPKQKKR
jgi:ketol-acid reductoisomerase